MTDLNQRLVQLIGPIEMSTRKANCSVYYGVVRVAKVRLLEALSIRALVAELRWLQAELLRPELVRCDIGGRSLSILTMDRLPVADCAAYRLVSGRLAFKDALTIIERLRGTVQPRSVGVTEIGRSLCMNLEYQLRNGCDDFPGATKGVVSELVMNWSRSHAGERVPLASHRNSFSPNVFLTGGSVILIDPRVEDDSRTRLPFFGDVATVLVDFALHDPEWASPECFADIISGLGLFEHRHGFVAVMIIKCLVRVRFARLEGSGTGDIWRDAQNRLILERASDLVDALLWHNAFRTGSCG